jgi:uroporphyrinogen decarboxylase
VDDRLLRTNPVTLDLPAALANLRRQGCPRRVFSFEHGLEPGIKTGLCERFDLEAGLDPSAADYRLRREIRVYQFLGLEFMRVFPRGIVWPGLPTAMTDIPPAVGPIRSWQDFEAYPWPTLAQVDLADLEWCERHLPDNMAAWSMTYLFQQVSNLLGFEPLCLLLYEDRELVKAVTARVGKFYVGLTETLCQFTRFGAINVGDDMGHKTGTLVRPDDLREIFIPWHRRIIAAAQARGRLGFFHVCGQVEAIMDDLINTVRIDAKHSTQDVTEPIQRTKQRWGDRVALLGGVDIDFATRAQPTDVERYTRNILEACTPGGGFALGLGNWVADSIPLDTYLAVHVAARKFSLS